MSRRGFFVATLGYFSLLAHKIRPMVTIIRTTNTVRLSFLQALLRDAGIHAEVFDGNISALEAGIGAFPRRLVVNDAWEGAARRVLEQAKELYDD